MPSTAREVIRLSALRLGVTLPPTVVTTSTETVLQVLTQALLDIGALGEAETPNADQGADGLTQLQQMLNAWALDGIDYGLTALTLQGALAVPISHVAAVRANLAVALAAQYGVQPPPTVAQDAAAKYAYVRSYFRAAECLPMLQELLAEIEGDGIRHGAEVATLTATLYLPDNHTGPLRAMLAPRLAPVFGIQTPADLVVQAEEARRKLQAMYFVPPVLRADREHWRRTPTSADVIVTGPGDGDDPYIRLEG